MSLRKELLSFIEENHLFNNEDKLLLAVSGGVDSMVLLHLLSKVSKNIAVAHCNFKLRGVDADMDHDFVKEKAKKYGVAFHSKTFKTKEYAKAKGISIQMAARELRYNWFNDLRRQEGYKYIVTAHHKDDVAETVLLNLIRGTGIRGLHGIRVKKNNLVRPLLFATKDELIEYAADKKLAYKIDDSNFSTKYARNRIRLKVIPELQKVNLAAIENIFRSSLLIEEAETLLSEHIEEKLSELCTTTNDVIKVSIDKLAALKHQAYFLYELLAPFGFNESIVYDILSNLHGEAGKYYFSDTHRLLRDRNYLLLEERREHLNDVYTFNKNESNINTPVKLKLEVREITEGYEIPNEKNIASLDFDKLSPELQIRHWEKGDSFKPFGMKGKKKLSDFFIDGKFSRREKESTWLLTSGKDIVWVIGHRIDDRFKVGANTKQALVITLY